MMAALGRLVKGETDSTIVQFFRSGLVGGLAFAVDFAALAFLVRVAGVYYLTAAGLAFGLGLVTNYIISVLWVFDKHALKSPLVEFGLFIVLGVLGLGLTEVVLYVLTDLLSVPVLLSKGVATGITFAWNFISRKVLLFSVSSEPQAAPAGEKLESGSVLLGIGAPE
jgi:putative flippase GtrA